MSAIDKLRIFFSTSTLSSRPEPTEEAAARSATEFRTRDREEYQCTSVSTYALSRQQSCTTAACHLTSRHCGGHASNLLVAEKS